MDGWMSQTFFVSHMRSFNKRGSVSDPVSTSHRTSMFGVSCKLKPYIENPKTGTVTLRRSTFHNRYHYIH